PARRPDLSRAAAYRPGVTLLGPCRVTDGSVVHADRPQVERRRLIRRRRPEDAVRVTDPPGARAGEHRTSRRAAALEDSRDGGIARPVVETALRLVAVRQTPIGVAGESDRVQAGDLVMEGLEPRVVVVGVVDAPVVGELLPHQAGPQVGDRPVAVVDEVAIEP